MLGGDTLEGEASRLGHRVGIAIDVGELGAALECLCSKDSETPRQGDAGEVVATGKCFKADGCYAFGYVDAG